MKVKSLAFVCAVSALIMAAAATHVLILLPGDTGIIQCPGGVLTLIESSAQQVSAICGDAPTVTATATQTETGTPTQTATNTNTATPTASTTRTATPSATSTATPTSTATASQTASATAASTATSTATQTASATQTITRTPTATSTRTPTPTPSLTYVPLVMRLAVIGDSVQDEYRSNDNRGTPYQSTTFNWVELLANTRGLNFGAWGTRAEPRRSGYEYNWARSGATSSGALSSQLPGVLAQLQSGAATHVLIQVGINDFNQGDQLGYQIYTGALSGSALTTTLNHIADNISSIAQQANSAAPGRVLVTGIQDYTYPAYYPEMPIYYPDPAGQARAHAAFNYINSRVQAQAAIDGVHYWDYNSAFYAAVGPRTSGGNLVVGGQSIVWLTRGNEWHHAWLNESPYAHAGTALSGVIANLYVNAINSAFGASIAPLTDSEIVAAAGG